MKKIILLILCILFITGCSAKYNVEFREDSIVENINIMIDGNVNEFVGTGDGEYIEDEIMQEYVPMLDINDSYYERKVEVSNNKSNVYLRGSYSYDELEYSHIIKHCFEDIFINDTDDYIDIDLNNYICGYYGDLELSVSSYYSIIKTNSDYNKKGIYTWNFDTISDEGIELRIIKKHEENNKVTLKNVLSIILLVMFVISGGAIFFLKKKEY